MKGIANLQGGQSCAGTSMRDVCRLPAAHAVLPAEQRAAGQVAAAAAAAAVAPAVMADAAETAAGAAAAQAAAVMLAAAAAAAAGCVRHFHSSAPAPAVPCP